MSDEEICTLFENAEEWSPDNDAADNTGDTGAATPNNSPPALQLGSDVEIANCVAQFLRQQHGEVIFAEGRFWYYAGSHWRQFDDHELRLAAHRYDGATVPRSTTPVRLGSARVDSALNEMKAVLARPKFFAEAPPGINCASGFIAFAPDGTPTVQPHSPEHRCRHVLKGRFLMEANTLDPEKIFELCQDFGDLLAQLLEGVFRGDPDAEEKRRLLAEIAGAAALGYGTKLREPKAVNLEGKTAENGKSQVLDLFRGLLPPDATASITAAKMGDERFVVGLVGKHLNASDELSVADAIAADVFKGVVTGEPVTGRDVYRSAITFRSVALNVFATNTLPSFKGGMDRGVQRRLLVIPFNRTIPKDERVENIGLHIAENEANMLLTWAVAGASQLIRRRGFSIPRSSETALRDWLLSADPVLAWIQACVEEIDAKPPEAKGAMIKSKDAHADFVRWAKCEGFREITLPAVNGFVHRLRANRPSINVKHTNSGNFLTGIRIVSAESTADETDFFPSAPVKPR